MESVPFCEAHTRNPSVVADQNAPRPPRYGLTRVGLNRSLRPGLYESLVFRTGDGSLPVGDLCLPIASGPTAKLIYDSPLW